jgi:hypothetical protein
MLEGAVIGPLGLPGETAGGELPASQVVLQAFAADPFLGAGLVAAIASLEVLVLLAIHGTIPQ